MATQKAESQSELFKANFECLYPNRKPAITMRIFIDEAYIWKSRHISGSLMCLLAVFVFLLNGEARITVFNLLAL